jgi:hypothetical protein
MKRLIFLLLLSLARPALACVTQFNVYPPMPRYGDDVEVFMSGHCCNGGPAFGQRVRVEGSTIFFDFNTPKSGPTVLVPWASRASLGRLPGGTYDVSVRLSGNECDRRTITVADPEFIVTPSFGQAGTQIVLSNVITGECAFGDLPVTIGGVTVEAREHGDVLVLEAPPHAPGPVDVTITTDCGTITVPNGFRYGDGLPGDYEKVLFPITFAGEGANGSDWRSDNLVRSRAPIPIPADPVPLAPFAVVRMPEEREDGGRFLHVPRGMERWLSYGSHAVDRSRTSSSHGTEVPVVHVRDTANVLYIEDVPLDRHSRARLRVYDWDAQARLVSVSVRVAGRGPMHLSVPVTAVRISCPAAPCLQSEPGYGAIELPAFDEEVRATVTISSALDARLWAFVSVTGNETQHVTLFTPRHSNPQLN